MFSCLLVIVIKSVFVALTEERMWEDFNIYGAQGGDNSDSPETNTFDRYLYLLRTTLIYRNCGRYTHRERERELRIKISVDDLSNLG